jgi:hypothetical protein
VRGSVANRPARSTPPSPGNSRSTRAVWINSASVKAVPGAASQSWA